MGTVPVFFCHRVIETVFFCHNQEELLSQSSAITNIVIETIEFSSMQYSI
jgi:hypothetical protein